mgnify:FL=1
MNLDFDNLFTRSLPCDGVSDNHIRQVDQSIYSRLDTLKSPSPTLVSYSPETADLIGISQEDLGSPDFVQVFSGNKQLDGMDLHATCYGGHQFGNWAGQLGDGRAINLGEIKHNETRYMLQLKGAGPTPYSRSADGLAVLRSSLREYLCSEAMFHLGVPTTRALSLMTSGADVVCDMLYDGHPAAEPGAIVCRVSRSFIRFGHFQILAARNEIELLKQLVGFTIETQFDHLLKLEEQARYAAWFDEVCRRTAEMIVHWMRVGFVHGVMNTDNMSIIGETIDYGPYGWLDDFDPEWTPNTTDAANKRYRYSQQPSVAQWNLLQLANAILPLMEGPKPLEQSLSGFAKTYETLWQQMMSAKLGLVLVREPLISELLNILASREIDMTLFFRELASEDVDRLEAGKLLDKTSYEDITLEAVDSLSAWLKRYSEEILKDNVDEDARVDLMNRTNPLYVFRNYVAQLAIDDAEKGDYAMVDELLDVFRNPYRVQPNQERFAQKRPDWARTRVGCSMLSCSS